MKNELDREFELAMDQADRKLNLGLWIVGIFGLVYAVAIIVAWVL
jgi:hypothetical protein